MPVFRKGKWNYLENLTVNLSYKSIGSIKRKMFQGSIKKKLCISLMSIIITEQTTIFKKYNQVDYFLM